MKRLIPILFLSMMLILGTAFSASAMPIQLKVGTYGNGENSGWTSVFDQLGFIANTTTTQYGTLDANGAPVVNSSFTDVGNLNIDAFKGLIAPGHDEGLGGEGQTEEAYALTGTWNNITGFIDGSGAIGTKIIQTTQYNSGGTIDFYIDDDVDQNFGSLVCAEDDTGFGADSGTLKIGTITITGGTGTNSFDMSGNFIEGASNISGKFTYMADDFWYDSANPPYDLEDYYLTIGWEVMAGVDQNTDNVEIILPGSNDNFLFKICSDHDGSIEVAVPEPATMLLLGSGLIGLAGFGRKKKFFKKD